MIYGVVGTTGGGKSYFAVWSITQAIVQGRPVVTNLPLLPPLASNPLIHQWDWSYISPGATKQLDFPLGALYVLDECWKGFMAGNLAKNLGPKCLEFFKEHRHRKSESGVTDDIFLITQDFGDVPKCIRSLAVQTILCEKPDDVKMPDLSIRYYLKGAQTGLTVDKKEIVKTERIKLSPEIYSLYQSHSKASETSVSTVREGTALESNVFQSWRYKLNRAVAIACFLICPLAVYYLYTHVYPRFKKPDVPELTAAVNETKIEQPAKLPINPLPAFDGKKIESQRWRVVAFLASAETKREWVYIQDASKRPRRIDTKLCTREYGQLDCLVDGEHVTLWSGQGVGAAPSIGGGFMLAAKSPAKQP